MDNNLSEFLDKALDAFEERQRRDAIAEAEQVAATARARQAEAENALRPRLDEELTADEQAFYGMTVEYYMWDGAPRPYVALALPDITGKVRYDPARSYDRGDRTKDKWQIEARHEPTAIKASWSCAPGGLRNTLRLAIGQIAARLKERAERDARAVEEYRERERREKEAERERREAKWRDYRATIERAAAMDAELRPVIEAEVARLTALCRPPITATLYKATWQVGWTATDDDDDADAITRTGWAFTDTADDAGYIRVYSDLAWRRIRPNAFTLVWERFDITPGSDLPEGLSHWSSPTLTVKGVFEYEPRHDPDGAVVTDKYYCRVNDYTLYIHLPHAAAPWLLAELGLPAAADSYTLDLRTGAAQNVLPLDPDEIPF